MYCRVSLSSSSQITNLTHNIVKLGKSPVLDIGQVVFKELELNKMISVQFSSLIIHDTIRCGFVQTRTQKTCKTPFEGECGGVC